MDPFIAWGCSGELCRDRGYGHVLLATRQQIHGHITNDVLDGMNAEMIKIIDEK